MNQLKIGTILSYANLALTNVIGLFLTPFIIRSLGNSEYGLYILIGSIIAYISVLDLGLNNAVIRFVAIYKAQNDKARERKFLSTIFIVYSIISFFVIFIGSILYFQLDYLFKNSMSDEQLVKLRYMFVLLIFDLAVALPGGTFMAVCNAYQKFIFPRLVMLLKYLIRSLLIFILLGYFKGDAITMVWLDTILNIFVILLAFYYVFFRLKITFPIKFSLDIPFVKDIFSYSIWTFLYSVTTQLLWNSSQTFLGMNVSTVAVAIFGVGIMLSGYYSGLSGVLNSLLLPRAAKLTVAASNEKNYTDEMIKIGRINSFTMFLILGGFIIVGREFIRLWLGEHYINAWLIALLIMLSSSISLTTAFGNSILEAKKKNRFKALFYLITSTVALIVGYFVSKYYGLKGMIYPISIINLVNSIVMLFYYNKIFGFTIYKFLRAVFFKQLLLLIIVVILFSALKILVPIGTWLILIMYSIGFGIIYLIYNYILVFNQNEKKYI